MDTTQLTSRLEAVKVVPVIAIDDVDSAVPFADALIEGGLPVAEITFRTAAAGDVIERICKERPGVFVGAGTVLTVDNLKQAVDRGAAFAVSPGFDAKVVEAAVGMDFPFFPGIMTPTDIQAALALGVKIQKFFPAGAAGGPKMLQSLSAPYAHTGVRFIPTGGVSPENLQSYLDVKTVIAAGGTWIAKRDAIAAGDWEGIKANCRKVVELVGGLKS